MGLAKKNAAFFVAKQNQFHEITSGSWLWSYPEVLRCSLNLLFMKSPWFYLPVFVMAFCVLST